MACELFVDQHAVFEWSFGALGFHQVVPYASEQFLLILGHYELKVGALAFWPQCSHMYNRIQKTSILL